MSHCITPLDREPRRPGTALLIALALLMLGSALLAASSSAARASARAAIAHEAISVADAEARAVVARYVMAWGGAQDMLNIGGDVRTSNASAPSGIGAMPVLSRTRLVRLSSSRYVLAVECEVGPTPSLAVRRLSLVLDRALPIDTTLPPTAPVPAVRWALSDLF